MIKPPFDLRCEYLINPIGIDVRKPRFSWILTHQERNQKQSSYQLIVSSNENLSKKDVGDIWDSGKVNSQNHINIEYKGQPLVKNTKYYWKVKWWDEKGVESLYSQISSFETAFFEETDWIGKWISRQEFIEMTTRKKLQYKSGERGLKGRIREVHAIYLRKEFDVQKPIKEARIYICGVGYYELRLNGKKVGDRILDPPQTDYNKVTLYSTYDISDYLDDHNAVGVILGNGRCVGLFGYDYPKLILQIHIHYDDDTSEIIYTDEKWKLSNGPIQENGIYYGEKYDARLEMPGWDQPNFEDSLWKPAAIVPGYVLSSQMMQPIQITEILKTQSLTSPQPGMYVYDFGQNFTGFVRLKVRGPRGCQIQLRFAEILFEDGTINTATNRGAPATDFYILKGEGEEVFEPHFTYHGFRYVELTGFPGVPSKETIEGLFFHSNVPKVGNFHCSNELINKIHSNILWGQLSNLMSIPTDCAQRDERQGWMGDAQLVVEETIFNFDMASFYTKYLRDIKLSQKEDGSISDVVPPYWRIYPADPAWGPAYITIAWYMYWYYNDIKVFEDHYDSIKKYVDFLTSMAKENIFSAGKYGDWCPPMSIVSRRTPIELISTWYYYHDTLIFSKIAKIIGNKEDFQYYSEKAVEIKNAFNKKFLKSVYKGIIFGIADNVSQTSNVLPLYLDMVPEEKKRSLISTLIEAIERGDDCHINAGIIGTRYLFEVLTNCGHPEIAYKMITQKSYPGYGYMIKEGATTLWERWEKLESSGMNSHNHIMLGSVDTWFYNTLVGIKSLEPGWKSLRIKPYIPKDVNYANASLNTYRGLISCSWEKIALNLKLTVITPVGSAAEVWIPLIDEYTLVKEGKNVIWKEGNSSEAIIGIEFIALKENYVVFKVGSGHYQFTIQPSRVISTLN